MIPKKAEEFIYRKWKQRSVEEQRQHLPDSLEELDEYRERYGLYPGEIVTYDGDACVVVSVEGPPTMNAVVTYKNINDNQTREIGLAGFQRKLDRKL